MDIQQVSSYAVAFLTSAGSLGRTSELESRTLSAIREAGSEAEKGGDRLSIRLGRMRYSATRLMEAGDELAIEQTRLTIAHTAQRMLNNLQAELSEIERLITAVAEGEVSESQLEDVQNLIELRLARMDEIVSQAGYSGNELFTGERVRITTGAVSGEGFEFYYPEVSTESLGLGALDVTSQAPVTASGIVEEAADSLAALSSDVSEEIVSLGMVVERRISEFKERFEGMRSSEMLNAPVETSRLAAGSVGSVISSSELRTVLDTIRLNAEVVTSLLS